MNQFKLTLLALAIYSGAYLLLFLMWGALLKWGPSGLEQAQYISYIHDALLMLTAHILTILNVSPPPPPTGAIFAGPASTQSGFAKLSMLISIALGCLLLMTGCASQLQAVSAFNDSAVVSIRAANDIMVGNTKAALCATTLDTFARHAELTDAVVSLCLSPNSAASQAPAQAEALKTFKASVPVAPK